MSRQIVLVRHGETEWSRDHKHTSYTDLPLTERGREQALEAGRRLKEWSLDLILSSPMRRALDTCELAGLKDAAEITDDLREWNYGDYEGLTTKEIRQTVPNWTVWTHPSPNGETPEQVRERVDRVIERAASQDGVVALFAHGHILRVIGARWMGLEVTDGARLRLDTGTLSELGYERETRVISVWNG